jgi:predicted transcriptional regulator
MRTTLDLDQEVLDAIKEIARRTGESAGSVLSELARRALTQTVARQGVREPESCYGFRPIPARGKIVTNAHIDRLRDDEGI